MIYKDKDLIPIGNILGNYQFKTNLINFNNDLKLDLDNYSYDEFYKIAKANNCSVDIFEYQDKWYIPTNNGLMLLRYVKDKHLRRINNYSKWYKKYNKKEVL